MKTNTIIAIALASLLAACAQFPQFHPQNSDFGYYWIKPGQAHPSNKVAALIYYADYVRNLSPAEYTQEVEHARLLFTQEKSDFCLLQYVLVLWVVHNGDANKVQQLIEPLLKGNKTIDPELAAFARFLDADLAEDQAERRRFEAEIKRAETETKRAEAEAKRAGASARRAESGVKRVDELEKQVEAIKNIEKNLIGRDKSSGEKQ